MTTRAQQEFFEVSSLPPPWNQLLPFFVKASVWSLLFAVVWMLRSFFLLIFLTFVFAYIQAHVVKKLGGFIPHRPLRVVIVGLCVLLLIVGVFGFLFPRFREQADLFTSRYTEYLHVVDSHLVRVAQEYPVAQQFLPALDGLSRSLDQDGLIQPWAPSTSVAGQGLGMLIGIEESTSPNHTKELLLGAKKVTTAILSTGSAFLLSLLFSFLIVLDLPSLTRSVVGLGRTRIGFIYHEVSDTIFDFGRVLGAALEAQLFIAILNTILTAICLYFLGLANKVVFLSLIVFLCSFIPVAGVFISSIPICLLTLQMGGVFLMLTAALVIWLIHMVEAYILNPRIYGHHLRINPVLVLIILTIAGKLFGVWGLILGLPICTYVFQHAIRRPQEVLLKESTPA